MGTIDETLCLSMTCEIWQNKKGSKAMAQEMVNKSIVDQIMDAWFAELENTKEFDASTVERLKHLASRRTLKKPAQVTKAIKVVSEVQDETH
jgi:hypothetical protein